MKIGSFLWFFEKGPKYTAILAIALLAVLLLPGSFYIVLGVPRLPADWRQTFFVLFVLAFVTTALLPVIQLLAKPCIRKVERRKLIRSLRNLSRDEIEILQEHLAKNMRSLEHPIWHGPCLALAKKNILQQIPAPTRTPSGIWLGVNDDIWSYLEQHSDFFKGKGREMSISPTLTTPQ